ncbi:MAG TPA: 50S ribosomal protein L15 [Candidatus Solibacter sp.]|jgi:large subunit ribosomal protein L15|nr:50S ribosomal protein L15 [Candidatus Solibacter sp.]
MKAHELQPTPGSHRQRKRVGRGISSGQGKTSGRGQKGQGSRSSVGIPTSFEGGQMPLSQRLPKLRGFTNINRREFAVVNLGKLNRFEAGTEVNPEMLKEAGLVRKRLGGVKILAAGELKVALKVSAHRISAGAVAQIEAAGGSVELIGPQTADKTPRRHKKKAAKAEVEDEPKAKTPKAEAAAEATEAQTEESSQEQAEAVDEADEADEAEPQADSGEAESSPEE